MSSVSRSEPAKATLSGTTRSLSPGERYARANHNGRLTAIILFLPPALLLFTIFVIMPIFEAGVLGFFRWNGYGEATKYVNPVGFQNYERLAGNRAFTRALLNTGGIIIVSLAVQLPLALAMALLVAKRFAGAYLFRTIFFLPFILAEVATGLIWRFVYDGEFGLVSAIWGIWGAEAPFVLADRTWAIYAIMIVVVWKYFGWHMMIYIAGIQNIPSDLTDAARMDGATRWQVTRYVTIPLLMPAIRVSTFFAILGSLQLFDLVMPLTRGGPSNATQTIVTYLYNFGIERTRIGFGSAVGVVLFLICLAFAVSYGRTLFRKE